MNHDRLSIPDIAVVLVVLDWILFVLDDALYNPVVTDSCCTFHVPTVPVPESCCIILFECTSTRDLCLDSSVTATLTNSEAQ